MMCISNGIHILSFFFFFYIYFRNVGEKSDFRPNNVCMLLLFYDTCVRTGNKIYIYQLKDITIKRQYIVITIPFDKRL